MDFRSVDASSVRWMLLPRGAPGARTPQGAKIVVQTPTCPARVSLARPGMYRVELALSRHVPVHSAFCDWIAALEESASEAQAVAAFRAGKRRSDWVYSTSTNASVSLTVFSDTLAFDEKGVLSADLMSARGVTALIELQGLWSTDAKWGMRWRVTQLKFTTTPPELPPAFEEDTGDVGEPQQAFAFLD